MQTEGNGETECEWMFLILVLSHPGLHGWRAIKLVLVLVAYNCSMRVVRNTENIFLVPLNNLGEFYESGTAYFSNTMYISNILLLSRVAVRNFFLYYSANMLHQSTICWGNKQTQLLIATVSNSVAPSECTGWAKKNAHYTLVHIFAKYWPIFIIPSLTDSAGNLQQNVNEDPTSPQMCCYTTLWILMFANRCIPSSRWWFWSACQRWDALT